MKDATAYRRFCSRSSSRRRGAHGGSGDCDDANQPKGSRPQFIFRYRKVVLQLNL
jgi:hypothetical protein